MEMEDLRKRVSELSSFRDEAYVTFVSQYGKKNKELRCTCRGSFEVWHNKEKKFETMQPFTAVEKYESL